jgi:hypothetical protein
MGCVLQTPISIGRNSDREFPMDVNRLIHGPFDIAQ